VASGPDSRLDRSEVERLRRLKLAGLEGLDERGLSFGAVLLSLLPVIAAGGAILAWPGALEPHSGVVWVLAMAPVFALSYRRGWRGAALALIGTMAILTLVEVWVVQILGYDVRWWVYGAAASVLCVAALGAGWVTERLYRERRRAVDDALHLAFVDPATGVGTRRAVEIYLDKQFAAAERGEGLAVVLFGLHGFRDFRTEVGPEAAARVLEKVGDLLESATREMDMTGRWSGSEFLAVLGGERARGASVLAERVRSKAGVLSLKMPDGSTVGTGITCCAGVAEYAPNMDGPPALVAAARYALDRARDAGGNCVEVFGRHQPESGRGKDREGREASRQGGATSGAGPAAG